MRIPCACGIDSWSEVEFRAHAGHAELADRRQRAREAYYDSCARRNGAPEGSAMALEEAIETATRVRITPEVVEAAAATGRGFGFALPMAIEAAFRAAGFEVEQ